MLAAILVDALVSQFRFPVFCLLALLAKQFTCRGSRWAFAPSYDHDSLNCICLDSRSRCAITFHSRIFWPWDTSNPKPIHFVGPLPSLALAGMVQEGTALASLFVRFVVAD